MISLAINQGFGYLFYGQSLDPIERFLAEWVLLIAVGNIRSEYYLVLALLVRTLQSRNSYLTDVVHDTVTGTTIISSM